MRQYHLITALIACLVRSMLTIAVMSAICATNAQPGAVNQNERKTTFLIDESVDPYATCRELADSPTEEACSLLLDIALGSRKPSVQEMAASRYLKIISHPRDARALLTASNEEVLAMAMSKLRREPIDSELLADLERLLGSSSSLVRYACARVIAEAPSTTDAPKTVQVAADCCRTAHMVDGARELTAFAHEAVATRTRAGLVYQALIRGLAFAPAISLDALRMGTPVEAGPERDCLLLARATRGEWALRDEVERIVESAIDPGIRWAALEAFRIHGKQPDIPLLEHVADNDTFVIQLSDGQRQIMADYQAVMGITDGVSRDFYPNRWHAVYGVIPQIQGRSGTERSGP